MLGVMALDGRGRGNLMGSLFPQSPDNHRLEVVIVNQGNLCLGTIEVAYCWLGGVDVHDCISQDVVLPVMNEFTHPM